MDDSKVTGNELNHPAREEKYSIKDEELVQLAYQQTRNRR